MGQLVHVIPDIGQPQHLVYHHLWALMNLCTQNQSPLLWKNYVNQHQSRYFKLTSHLLHHKNIVLYGAHLLQLNIFWRYDEVMSDIDASNWSSNIFQFIHVKFKRTFILVKKMGSIIPYWIWGIMTCSRPRRPLFLHTLSFECTTNLCINFLNQFSVYFHI